MVVMMVLVIPAINLKGAGDVTKTVYDVQGILDQARAFAMANNTYVFVGFSEPNTGTVLVATVASKDGTRGYDVTGATIPAPAWPTLTTLPTSNLNAIGKLQKFDNIHLASNMNGPGSVIPTGGGLARPEITGSFANYYAVGDMPVATQPNTFTWPPGTAAPPYTFDKVINFDPQGSARVQTTGNSDTIPAYMEIGLQQTHGTLISTGSNVAAIQVDGMSGATRIYRP
jgi:hypothetical protein